MSKDERLFKLRLLSLCILIILLLYNVEFRFLIDYSSFYGTSASFHFFIFSPLKSPLNLPFARGEVCCIITQTRLQASNLLYFYRLSIHLKEEPLYICNSSLSVVKMQVFAYLIISIRCKGTAFIFSFNLYLLQRRCSFYLQFISIRSRGATQHISIKG